MRQIVARGFAGEQRHHLHHPLPMGQEINAAVSALDKAIATAVDASKAAGLRQGLIVVLFHGHVHVQTHQMVT